MTLSKHTLFQQWTLKPESLYRSGRSCNGTANAWSERTLIKQCTTVNTLARTTNCTQDENTISKWTHLKECKIRSQHFRDDCVHFTLRKLKDACKSMFKQVDQFNNFHSFQKWLSEYCNSVKFKTEYIKMYFWRKTTPESNTFYVSQSSGKMVAKITLTGNIHLIFS